LKTKEYNPKFISKSKLDKAFTDNIYTADIETLTKIDDKGRRYFEAYSVAYYDGNNAKSYYVSDYNNWEEMMNKFFNDLFSLNLKNTDIYFHNLSGFDINFLLKPLLNIEGVKSEIMLREDKFIQIKITYGKGSFNLKDSLLLLPGSLMNLSKSFKIETPKEIFPRKLFENETFSADFISKNVPDYNKYFNHSEVSLDDYKKYSESFKGKVWSLKTETLKYVDIDCISLHQILIKFGNIIYNRWGIDIKHTPTLPALCLKIYRAKYMPKNTIPIITGIPYRDIKQSYTGGSTDMYIPYGENIFCYDINSLYPTAMKNYKYPTGKYYAFNNLDNLSWVKLEQLLGRKLFGFVEAEIDCPKVVLHPILQIRREISPNSPRTFSPAGTFRGWFHTEEILEAMKLGYKINIISGYLFEEAEIFNDYIDDLYRIKVDADKNKDAIWRLISKNLMNSLYGRFGMDQYLINNVIIDKDDLQIETLLTNADIEDVIELDDKLLIQYLPEGFDSYSYQENLELDISIVIASSVTAYSRIIMSQFKNLNNNKMYYTDTDSAVMEKPLSDSLVGKHLGQMVLEKEYKEFVALAPKVYGGILNNGKIITKVKGFKNTVTFDNFKSLLEEKKSLELNQSKWFRFIDKGSISIKSQIYTLIPTANKRNLIYKNNKLVSTEAFVLNNKSD
jgi:hypothetical protein